LRRSILACGLLLAFAGLCATATAGSARLHLAVRTHTHTHELRLRATGAYRAEIQKFRRETWYWQHLMGLRPSPVSSRRTLAGASSAELHAVAVLWKHRASRAHRKAQHPPRMQGWMCIHRYEGAWNDRGGPYYGGLQMSYSFQEHWGGWLLARKGTADHWTPLEQIWTATKASRSLGFYPWPNTARICGLL
jgi:hypothetical protein